jgi:hypothetical protein
MMVDVMPKWKSRPSAWPYRADPPQRYWGQYQRYQERGGLVDLEEDIRGFITGGHVGDISRFYFFCMAFDLIHKEGLPGDLAELGVYRGNTATLLARIARRLGRHAYLLDTFEGFDKSDLRGVDAGQPVQFTDTSLDGVRSLVGEENVEYIKGHFPDSASALPETSYCLVHVDCDLYAPIMSALEYFYPRLVPGGFLIIHDYSSMAWDGAERAVDEFFEDKPEPIVPLTDGAGSVVIRKMRDRSVMPSPLVRRRRAQFSQEWATGREFRDLLGSGWSGCEDWGVWAVGSSHELLLAVPATWDGDLAFEADVHAPLITPIDEQEIKIFVDGQEIGQWHFAAETNRGVRQVRVPRAFIPPSNGPTLRIEFRPLRIVKPADFGDARGDVRPLTMALHRIRRTAA